MRIRKHMTVRRSSVPPIEDASQTWSEVVFFPFSKMVLAFMAAMLLIYLCAAWLDVPADEHHEDYIQPPPMVMEFPKVDPNATLEGPPAADTRPAGGIVIEK